MLQQFSTALSLCVFSVGISLCLAASAAHAQVYKWIGTDGSVQYGDTPPDSVKTQKLDASLSIISPGIHPQSSETKTSTQKTIQTTQSLSTTQASQPSYADLLEKARLRAIERCLRNRGTNCEEEADAQTYPSYSAPTYVIPYRSRTLPIVGPSPADTGKTKTPVSTTKKRWVKQTNQLEQ